MTNVEMARTLQRICKGQNDVDALKRELDGLKDTVKAEMVATGEHKIEAGGCIATYQEVTSNRFNSSAHQTRRACGVAGVNPYLSLLACHSVR